jgi:hypothetical protein
VKVSSTVQLVSFLCDREGERATFRIFTNAYNALERSLPACPPNLVPISACRSLRLFVLFPFEAVSPPPLPPSLTRLERLSGCDLDRYLNTDSVSMFRICDSEDLGDYL